jgi:hypothetical protein
MPDPSNTAQWLIATLGASGETAEHIVFTRGRRAGLSPGAIRTAARELSVERYEGAKSRMWRLPRRAAA